MATEAAKDDACNFTKKGPDTSVFLLVLRNFKNTYFIEHIRTTAYIWLLKITIFADPDGLRFPLEDWGTCIH